MTRDSRPISRVLLFALAAALLVRLATLGMYPLMDTTESRYAEIARKMVELNDWITPWFDYGTPFWGKPPLSFWLTAASFKLLGFNEFAARVPHWLAGALVVWLVWNLSARRDRREAWYALTLLIGSMLFFVADGAVMTDMALTLGTTLAMRGFWLGLHGTDEERARERWLLFVGAGIGLLAKGPIALVLIALPVAAWAVTTRNVATVWRGLPWLRGSLVVLAIALPWYALAELRTPGFLEYFLVGEHWQRFVDPGWKGDLYGSAHDHPRGTIWMFAFVDLLPWSVLLPVAALVWRRYRDTRGPVPGDRNWRIYLLSWGLAPAVFFTAAGNILWPYVLPGVPALALWAGAWLARQRHRESVERLLICGVTFPLVVTTAFLVALPISRLGELKSAKALIADYDSHRKRNEALIFLGNRPFSGEFYSHGRAEEVSSAAQLASRLEQAPAFVAIKAAEIGGLPARLKGMLKPVSKRGNLVLFLAERRNSAPLQFADGRADGLD
ncbi:MAG: glycosyltransferase family 39 protein [Betaproteobacteria bacterium]|jgi:4-amino-4-deoxy-L-arabinose transferase-like glycosyltransferase|nr:glycosyltransferase family 39 protein [Betaproteobacteria bacterium]